MTDLDRKYHIGDICTENFINENYKCGVCLDILRSPIQCEAGHSWCHHCIKEMKDKESTMKKCPTCSNPIDSLNPIINFALKSIIDTLSCKCPHSIPITNFENNNSNTSADPQNKVDTEICNWRGRYEELDNHLKACLFAPYCCTFKNQGCDYVGTKKSLLHHYHESRHEHSLLVLSNKSMDLESSIIQIRENRADLEEDVKADIRKVKRKIETLGDAATLRIKWKIANVDSKCETKEVTRSNPFIVCTPNGEKYNMQLVAKFGIYDRNRNREEDNSLGLFLTHLDSESLAFQSPIDITGTSFTLLNYADPKLKLGKVVYCLRHRGCKCNLINIHGSEKEKGIENFCDDLYGWGGLVTINNEINIIAEVLIKHEAVELFNY